MKMEVLFLKNMCVKMDLVCVLFVALCYLTNANAINVISYQPQLKVHHVKRQVGILQSQPQQQQQLQRYDQDSLRAPIASKESIFRPMVRFLTATPKPQQSQAIGNNLPVNDSVRLDNHQSKTFITQQQQQHSVPLDLVNQLAQRNPTQPQQQQQHFFTQSNQQKNFNQQHKHVNSVPSLSSLKQSSNPPQISQNSGNSLQQQHSQQQVPNSPHNVRLPYQTQQPQQSLQLQSENVNFRRPQMTAATQHQQMQQYEPQSRPPHSNSVVSPSEFNSTNAIINPLLPWQDESLTPFNFTLSCENCCIEGQKPCQYCCDTRPLLSATVLKSATG